MKRYNYQIRDASGRLWAEADSTGPLESACYRGQVLYRYDSGSESYVVDEDQPSWMERPAPEDATIFMHPSKMYRADFIVTVRRGDVVGKSNDRDAAIAIANAGKRRALWQWVETQYVHVPIDPPMTHVKHGHHMYKRPVKSRDEWLVTAASGRVWARGNKVEDVLEASGEGTRRALWQWVETQYVLRAVGGKWLDMRSA